MTASEAKELMQGSTNYKGKWFKTRLAWFCGRINKKIENAAEVGDHYTIFFVKLESTARKYFPLLAQFYEDLEYYVVFSYKRKRFEIYWDLSKLNRYALEGLQSKYYDHPIKLEEQTNEDNSKTNGNRKNKRTNGHGARGWWDDFDHK
jgi:hypothetical protein